MIAEGGYGRVWIARDRFLARPVVLKELLARWRGDPRVARTFLQEARIAGELDHPNVVRVYAVEQHGEDSYIVMEHVPGGTLAERMGDGRLPLAEALRVADGVLAALEAAHARGVIHRDVKPTNVLLGGKGEVKVADFGIAQLTSQDPQRTVSGLTTGSFHPGTLQYMSPEQARGLPLDARSDLYAVGALLHRMATGRAHVDTTGLDEFTARNAVAAAAPPAPTGDAGLDEVLGRALAPDPAQRYPSAHAFRMDVQALANRVVEPA
jgi:serine/threonine protein kinase